MRAPGSLITPALIAALAVATPLAPAGTPTAWSTAANGFWDVAANWDPAVVPGASDDIHLGLTGPYTVDVRLSQSAGSLLISNPSARLDISVFRILSMFGPVENHGVIVVNPTQAGANAQLRYEAASTLAGTGVLNLIASGGLSELATAPDAVITHAPGHEILGRGRVSAELVNNGLVSATVPGSALLLDASPKTNNAVMRAVDASILRLGPATISQGPQGLILADGPGSRVELSSPVITGGTLRGQGGGVVSVTLNALVDNVRAEGDLDVQVFRILDVQNTLTNDGRITVNPTQAGATAMVRFQDGATLSGDGEVYLAANASLSEVATPENASMTHAAGHTIRGLGRVSASMTNNARINADQNNGRMQVFGVPKTNNALMHATNGGILELVNVTIGNGPGGIIRAEDASRVELQNAVITAGVLESTGSGRVVSTLDSTLNSVETRGSIDVMVFRTMSVNTTLTNNGLVTVNPTQAGASANLHFADGAVLTGQGAVHLAAHATLSQINTNPDHTMTHAAGHTIRGRGQINARMANHGLVTADQPTGTMTLSGQTKINHGAMQAANAGRLLLQNVAVEQSATGALTADGAGSVVELSTATVTGGAIDTVNGGLVRVTDANATIADAAIDALVHVGVFRTLTLQPGVTLNGGIVVNPTAAGAAALLHWGGTFQLDGQGVITLAASSGLSEITAAQDAAPSIGPGLRLEGVGRINAPLTVRGTLAPGTSVGAMHAAQPVTLTPTAAFEAEIASPANADRLTSTSSFHADGTLVVNLVDGFSPASYWTATVVTAAQGVTGSFAHIMAPAPADPRLQIRARYLSTEIRVGAFCKADTNADGLLNFFDVSDFLALYNAQDPAADIAAPFGVINFFDIAAYIQSYNQGCP
jgi:hypothetical protein